MKKPSLRAAKELLIATWDYITGQNQVIKYAPYSIIGDEEDEELSVHMHLICFHTCFVHSNLPSMLTSLISFHCFFF